MKLFVFWLSLLLYHPFSVTNQRLVPPKKYHSEDDDDDHPVFGEDDEEVFVRTNSSEKGMYVGAPCETTCSSRLQHVLCNPVSNICECEKKYPVRLNNPYAGCTKPRKLGDQCYYREACRYTDQHASCIQVHHNAICQCEDGYHSVAVQKPTKKIFCAKDVVAITKDFSTFAGVLSGIAILSGLICFVLHLFNQNLYGSRHRHRFGNANLPPPILFSSDPGSLPLPIMERSIVASRASTHRTFASSSMTSRRSSSAPGYRGVVVSASRAGAARTAAILLLSYCHLEVKNDTELGSRRPSVASIQSSGSLKSYTARRFEREREQKEEREMQRRLSKMKSNSNSRIAPTPSPHSTDDLLPTLEEDKQTESSSTGGITNTTFI